MNGCRGRERENFLKSTRCCCKQGNYRNFSMMLLIFILKSVKFHPLNSLSVKLFKNSSLLVSSFLLVTSLSYHLYFAIALFLPILFLCFTASPK